MHLACDKVVRIRLRGKHNAFLFTCCGMPLQFIPCINGWNLVTYMNSSMLETEVKEIDADGLECLAERTESEQAQRKNHRQTFLGKIAKLFFQFRSAVLVVVKFDV